ncbi:MAG: GrrA/OscA1 family cyclophane-containing rSAM-modified RiPP [Cyanobacteriota bacterium]|nr:GrrA/OscA1 family cyclophane-containing rSAM-modified RiPP [Cyanobacteriota bacterium]
MPQSRSAGLLAFLLALPSLALVVPPAAEAAATATAPQAGPVSPADAMERRLQRLSEAVRARSTPLDGAERAAAAGEPWVAAGAWGNGRGRGWANRGWTNRVYGNTYYGRPVWANYRPGWGNFRNSPVFLNW